MLNTIVNAYVMALAGNDDDSQYKSGAKYDKNHKWWNESDLKQRRLPVYRHGFRSADNILGHVNNLTIRGDKIIATMILNLNDPDDKITLHSSSFYSILKEEKGGGELKKGKIIGISVGSNRKNPYRMGGYSGWKITKTTEKNCEPNLKEKK